ncbi:hypothetical protein MBLNU13_g04345t1 [Cladosporium sp. NU13]
MPQINARNKRPCPAAASVLTTFRSRSRMVPAPTSWRRKFIYAMNLNGATRLTSHSAKKQVTDQGGKIETEFKLVKGFSASFPKDTVHTLASNEHIEVENDGEVTTQ